MFLCYQEDFKSIDLQIFTDDLTNQTSKCGGIIMLKQKEWQTLSIKSSLNNERELVSSLISAPKIATYSTPWFVKTIIWLETT